MKRKFAPLRRLCITAAVIAVGLCGGLLFARPARDAAVEAGAWGLHFQQPGDAPTGTVSQSVLDGYDAAYVGSGDAPVLYLTFDAGYEAGYTAHILDVLQAHNVPAAFFVVGHYIETQPDLVRRMAAEGHIVGNHTFHHYDMSKLSAQADFARELDSLAELYEQTVGAPLPRYYRPPQGVYSEENLKMAQALGYHTVFWSLAYVDWYPDQQPSLEDAYAKLLPRVHNGAVVLLHATSRTNSEILDALLTKWEALGYRFGTLDELFA